MDATPLLLSILEAFDKHKLECVMIGNSAAALQGAPVTTLDFDFMFRETPTNMRKLKGISRELDAVILRPYYPVSKLYRIVSDTRGIQLDFMSVLHGIRSFESLRSRAVALRVGRTQLLVASLSDIIESKRKAGRKQDQAVLPTLEKTLRETETVKSQTEAKTQRSARRSPRRK